MLIVHWQTAQLHIPPTLSLRHLIENMKASFIESRVDHTGFFQQIVGNTTTNRIATEIKMNF